MKIKTQIFITGLLLTLIPLAFVSTTLICVYQHELNEVIIDELRSVTTAQIEIIDNFFQERNANMGVISDYEILHELLEKSNRGESIANEPSRETMELILKAQKNRKSYLYSITAVDLNLQMVACTEPSNPGDKNQLGSLQALEELGTEVRLSPIVEAGEYGARKRCIVAIKAIYNRQQQRVGYLIEEVGLDVFVNLRISTNLIKTGYIYITDGSGGLITAGSGDVKRSDFITKSDERGNFAEKWAARDLSQPVGVVSYTIDGCNYLSGYGGFDNANWQILSSVCLDDILNTKSKLFDLALAAIAVIIVLVAAVHIIMRRMFTAPMEQMLQTFVSIRRDNDFSRRIEGIPNNEIGGIADGVNSLLADIECTIRHQRESLRVLKERAERDALTNLFNQREIQKLISLKLENAYIHKLPLLCVMLDVDDFKDFNTQYGHAGGDRAICYVAEAMREISGDTAGRTGGDEFVMCIDSCRSRDEAMHALQAFLAVLRRGTDIAGDGGLVPVPCSIGAILLLGGSEQSYESIMQAIDKAMYEVKSSNKNDLILLEL